ncbi:MAG: hypothetical protein HUU46_06355 [Candidatus Hydrogenedentes bacterium]|nr:hypothetical protein [Candidatus Hydrogenedentota bacterium]
MPTLHVRNVPEELYDGLKSVAAQKSISIGAEVVSMIERALEQEKRNAKRKALVHRIVHRRVRLPKGAPTPEAILRKDRDR